MATITADPDLLAFIRRNLLDELGEELDYARQLYERLGMPDIESVGPVLDLWLSRVCEIRDALRSVGWRKPDEPQTLVLEMSEAIRRAMEHRSKAPGEDA